VIRIMDVKIRKVNFDIILVLLRADSAVAAPMGATL
jgi:hypothetical protein